MEKVSIHPSLVRLSPTEFKKWFGKTLPDIADKWEEYYKGIGGKIPKKSNETE